MQAGAAGAARDTERVTTLADLDFLVREQGHLVTATDAAGHLHVPVRQVRVGPKRFASRSVQQDADAGARDALLFSFVAAAGHGRSSRALYITACGPAPVRRAPNPWDRFYRYHEAPWRGERDLEPLRPWLGDGPVLELGCGNGKLLRPLRMADAGDVVGIDIAWHAVRKVGGVLADAAVLPFAEGTFSSVMDIHCTGHLTPEGRAAAFQEAMRVLRPGGHFVVRRLGPDDLRARKGEAPEEDAGTRVLQDGRSTHFTSEDELVQALRDAGFKVRHRDTIVHRPRLRSERVTRQNVHAVGQKPL